MALQQCHYNSKTDVARESDSKQSRRYRKRKEITPTPPERSILEHSEPQPEESGKQTSHSQQSSQDHLDKHNSGICLICQKIDIYALGSAPLGTYPSLALNYGSEEEFLKSSRECSFCQLLCRAMKLDLYPTNSPKIEIIIRPEFGFGYGARYRDQDISLRALDISSSLRKATLAVSTTEG